MQHLHRYRSRTGSSIYDFVVRYVLLHPICAAEQEGSISYRVCERQKSIRACCSSFCNTPLLSYSTDFRASAMLIFSSLKYSRKSTRQAEAIVNSMDQT